MKTNFKPNTGKKGNELKGKIGFKPNERSVILNNKRKPENQIKDVNCIREFARK